MAKPKKIKLSQDEKATRRDVENGVASLPQEIINDLLLSLILENCGNEDRKWIHQQLGKEIENVRI